MYGFLFRHLQSKVVNDYGNEGWIKICQHCGFPEENFEATQRYPDHYIVMIADAVVEVLKVGSDDFFESAGLSFVRFLRDAGYNTVISVLGRNFRDFLKSVNQLHEYVSAHFPGLEAPIFILKREDKNGLELHYISKRNRLVFYLVGILKGVAADIYDTALEIDILREEVTQGCFHAFLRLNFINDEFAIRSWGLDQNRHHLPISLSTLLHIYPFAVILNKAGKIEYVGDSLIQLLPRPTMSNFVEIFEIQYPHTDLPSYNEILERTSSVYHVIARNVKKNNDSKLHLRGQMIHLKSWEMMMFLGTPVIPTLDFVLDIGLFLNDLPMHDFSRDNVLNGTQELSELRLSLESEQEKTVKIRDSIVRLDEEMDRTNRLLYQMIPQHVAEQLKAGESPVTTCKTYECASILLSDVVKFTEMCSQLKPMDVVALLNMMYSVFDQLAEKHRVCKIETIGDAYMVVAGLQNDTDHAIRLSDMALEMTKSILSLRSPSTGEHLRIRVGISTGSLVAGIVGQKMPRYCLFGKTSLLSTVMEQSSKPMKIHLSQLTAEHLPTSYIVSFRGITTHPEFIGMKTYWLEGKREEFVMMNEEKYFGAGGESGTSNDGSMQDLSSPWCFPIRKLKCRHSCFLS